MFLRHLGYQDFMSKAGICGPTVELNCNFLSLVGKHESKPKVPYVQYCHTNFHGMGLICDLSQTSIDQNVFICPPLLLHSFNMNLNYQLFLICYCLTYLEFSSCKFNFCFNLVINLKRNFSDIFHAPAKNFFFLPPSHLSY